MSRIQTDAEVYAKLYRAKKRVKLLERLVDPKISSFFAKHPDGQLLIGYEGIVHKYKSGLFPVQRKKSKNLSAKEIRDISKLWPDTVTIGDFLRNHPDILRRGSRKRNEDDNKENSSKRPRLIMRIRIHADGGYSLVHPIGQGPENGYYNIP